MTFIQHHDHPTATHKVPPVCVFFRANQGARSRAHSRRSCFAASAAAKWLCSSGALSATRRRLSRSSWWWATNSKMRIAQFFLHAIGYFWISSLFAETFIDTQIRVKSENHVLQVLFRTNFPPHSLFGPLAALRHHESQPESLIRRFEIAS